jgi:hypothetical protein
VIRTIDLRRELPHCYSAGRTPAVVEVPEIAFLAVDGHGDPDTSASYAEAVRALYATAYAVRFALKREPHPIDAPVMPLEGLWWAPDMSVFTAGDRSAWHWTMLIALPAVVDDAVVEAGRGTAVGKVGPEAAARVRRTTFAEGAAAQVLHVGPYRAEGPAIAALHEFVAARGHALAGRHHEIYLSDPRRAAPERLRTILRQPVTSGA